MLADGFRWLEGPVWFADAQMLLFSDIPNNRVLRWVEGGVSVFREPSDFANGHARDMQGRLISCTHQTRCITPDRAGWEHYHIGGPLRGQAAEFAQRCHRQA